MKTASLVLGIIGGVLAIIFGVVFILGGVAANAIVDSFDQLSEEMEAEGWTVEEGDADISTAAAAVGQGITTIYVVGILSIVGAVLGIIGGAIVKKKNVIAGILMIVAAIPSFFTGLGIIASILFIIGGILALVSGKASAPAAA